MKDELIFKEKNREGVYFRQEEQYRDRSRGQEECCQLGELQVLWSVVVSAAGVRVGVRKLSRTRSGI